MSLSPPNLFAPRVFLIRCFTDSTHRCSCSLPTLRIASHRCGALRFFSVFQLSCLPCVCLLFRPAALFVRPSLSALPSACLPTDADGRQEDRSARCNLAFHADPICQRLSTRIGRSMHHRAAPSTRVSAWAGSGSDAGSEPRCVMRRPHALDCNHNPRNLSPSCIHGSAARGCWCPQLVGDDSGRALSNEAAEQLSQKPNRSGRNTREVQAAAATAAGSVDMCRRNDDQKVATVP